MSPASARTMKDWNDYVAKPCWNLPNEREKTVVHIADQQSDPMHPSTGRNTKMGRKVEKPRDPKSGGPSGQKERARHDKRHANK